MDFKFNSVRSLLVKFLAYIALIYLLLVVVSVIITSYVFINLDNYRLKIEQSVFEHSGYKLTIGNITTQLNDNYLPELILKNTTLINPQSNKQKIHIDNVDFILSYASILHLQPVFHKVILDGSVLNFEYNPDGSIFINGLKAYDPADQTLENVKAPFDIEGWLLLQDSITLSNIDLNYIDNKNKIPAIHFKNIKAVLDKDIWGNRSAYMDIFGQSDQNYLEAKLNWKGDKFEDWLKWKNADFKLSAMSKESAPASSIQRYIPALMSDNDRFLATSAIEASMKDGMIQKLVANFDVNNFKLALSQADVVNFPKLGGTLNISLTDSVNYLITANDLTMQTSAGYLFNNAQISGKYLVNKHGNVTLSNTNLVALNNLLSLFDATSGLSIDGTIKTINYNWDGGFLQPSNYQLNADFSGISLKSTRPEYPSLSNVSGDISLTKNAGKLNLALNNSVLNYDKIFLIPYEFKYLNSSADWSVSDKKIVTVNLHKTNLETKDFKAVAEGTYTYNPDNPISPSYISMTAHADRILVSKVGDYLPKAIPMSVHKWLNMGLVSGYGVNANMILKGPLSDFPFRDGKGLFYITADLDNAKLQYVKDWPPIEKIHGQFILKNTNITVKAHSAILQGNYLDPTTVVIPDYSDPNGVYLTADGKAHGSTANFMEYLKNTPVNNIIGKLPEKLVSSGNGNIKIYLKVPFKEPKHTEVKGIYHFDNNRIKFNLPIPELSQVDGDLGFSQHGVEIKDLSATAFNSKANLYAGIDKNNKMWFKITIPSLDYKAVSEYYLQPLSGLISGKSATEINFQIAKHGINNLSATSDMVGVKVDAPAPLGKSESTPSSLRVNIVPATNSSGVTIDWSYFDLISGQQYLASKSDLTTGQIKFGTDNYLAAPDSKAVMTINAKVKTINLEEWIATVSKVVKTIKENKESASISKVVSDLPQFAESAEHYQRKVFPMQIQLTADDLAMGKMSFGNGVANLMVDNKNTSFNFYSKTSNGFGVFNYEKELLNLTLDRYMLYKKPMVFESGNTRLSFVNGTESVTKVKLPDINLRINNLFYQNHNLGTISTLLHQAGSDLYLKNGTLTSADAVVKFNGVNYCFGCGRDLSYVDVSASATIKNLGNVI